MLFKKEWKEYMKEHVVFNSYRMNYCCYSKGQEGIKFWAGSYICYGMSKKGFYSKEQGKQVGELYYMGLTSTTKSIVNHHHVADDALAKRIVRRLKKSEYSWIYEVISNRPIKIKDDMYVFKVDITQPKWKVQAALFAHRGLDKMSKDEMKWALTLSDDDLMKWMLLAYCRREENSDRLWFNVDSSILGDNIDEGFKLFKRLLDGERITFRGAKKRFDNPFNLDGDWEFNSYIKAWLKKEGKRYSDTCTIGNKTFSVREW